MEEPSVLDYVLSRLRFRRSPGPKLLEPTQPAESDAQPILLLPDDPTSEAVFPVAQITPAVVRIGLTLPWRAVSALFFALIGQWFMEPTRRDFTVAIVFYALSSIFLVWAFFLKEWNLAALPEDRESASTISLRKNSIYILIPWVLISFISFGGDRFTLVNVLLWVGLVAFFLWAIWTPAISLSLGTIRTRIQKFVQNPSIHIQISGWGLLLLAAAALIIFFRFSQLYQIPGEPFSDHAEKLLDVSDVLNGQTSIFFPRNTGREAIQFYWTVAIIKLLGTGVSFISLKIGTVLIGLLTLPFIYLLGKEFANRRVAFLAVLLAGVAYWPNVISRIGLRFPLYPMFVAPTMYFFFRGLRTKNINDYLLSGVALGLGLHGYSPMRIVPFVLVILFGVYFLHRQARGTRLFAVTAFSLLAVAAFIVFLPLLRYMLANPEMFGYRALTRLGTTERDFPGPVGLIFLSNLWNAATMFFWNDGEIWVHSVVNRPALDVVTAALYFSGVVLLLVRYIRYRRWQDIVMLLSIPLLMMPSILSLAFPNENPSLNRTGGAIIPVFITAAIALDGWITALWTRVRSGFGRTAVVALVGCLLAWSLFQNYDLVFNQFKTQFYAGAWNTYEIGAVVQNFADSVGSPDTVYVVPYPYWVDTRLVAINAGYPTRDYALWPEDFAKTKDDLRAKLFILKQEDQKDIDTLKSMYPDGRLEYYKAVPYEGKDFWLFLVPPEKDILP
jgi:hypothetical protein